MLCGLIEAIEKFVALWNFPIFEAEAEAASELAWLALIIGARHRKKGSLYSHISSAVEWTPNFGTSFDDTFIKLMRRHFVACSA